MDHVCCGRAFSPPTRSCLPWSDHPPLEHEHKHSNPIHLKNHPISVVPIKIHTDEKFLVRCVIILVCEFPSTRWRLSCFKVFAVLLLLSAPVHGPGTAHAPYLRSQKPLNFVCRPLGTTDLQTVRKVTSVREHSSSPGLAAWQPDSIFKLPGCRTNIFHVV